MMRKWFIGGIVLFLASEGASFVFPMLTSPFLQIVFFLAFLLCVITLFRELLASFEKN